jgi:hypothetical protein
MTTSKKTDFVTMPEELMSKLRPTLASIDKQKTHEMFRELILTAVQIGLSIFDKDVSSAEHKGRRAVTIPLNEITLAMIDVLGLYGAPACNKGGDDMLKVAISIAEGIVQATRYSHKIMQEDPDGYMAVALGKGVKYDSMATIKPEQYGN